jgi:hypothetical protein
MTEKHKWSVDDDKAALRAYLDKLSKKEADTIAERLGISPSSFWMRVRNFNFLDTGSGLPNYADQSRRVWEDYKRKI